MIWAVETRAALPQTQQKSGLFVPFKALWATALFCGSSSTAARGTREGSHCLTGGPQVLAITCRMECKAQRSPSTLLMLPYNIFMSDRQSC